MIDHLSIGVSDLVKSAAYYDAVLAALGFKRQLEVEGAIGYGEKAPTFWIGVSPGGGPAAPRGFHIAFRAADRAAVEAFHLAAIDGGGDDAGKPGLRPHYHPNYYAAFVLDPDGHKIEAVCHKPD